MRVLERVAHGGNPQDRARPLPLRIENSAGDLTVVAPRTHRLRRRGEAVRWAGFQGAVGGTCVRPL